jgi:hypothetical protein
MTAGDWRVLALAALAVLIFAALLRIVYGGPLPHL